MNAGRIILGGLAAGLWMNVAGFLINGVLLGKRMEAEMLAVAPSLQGKGMGAGAMTGRVLTSFVIGLLVAWLYAAMRPRFGAGMKTAIMAALPVWVCGFVFYLDWAYMEMMTTGTYIIVSLVMAVTLVVAGAIAGWLYREPAAA
jgi:hypothetical protein